MSVTPSNLTVVILAAGLSQRLGFAKQLIVKNHQTLLAEKIQLAHHRPPPSIPTATLKPPPRLPKTILTPVLMVARW